MIPHSKGDPLTLKGKILVYAVEEDPIVDGWLCDYYIFDDFKNLISRLSCLKIGKDHPVVQIVQNALGEIEGQDV